MATAATRRGTTVAGMPVGRRTPRGRKRWYLAHTYEGREEKACEKVRKIIPSELLEDAFVMRREQVKKVHGEWVTLTRLMYPEYFVVVTKDVAALDKELRKLTFGVQIARGDTEHFAPMADEACAWYERMMDANHTIRTSTAHIVNGELQIKDGPLMGQESRVTSINRRKCFCTVAVTDGGGGFTEAVPMVVPFKS
ncbi:MAG: hypothetical protein IJ781_09060 [Atopobiaceae bacterium]|nr:hypothetical protein [Atopobiaceae bacterium]